MKNQPRRQVIVETDGQNIWLVKNEVSPLELHAILNMLLQQLENNSKK